MVELQQADQAEQAVMLKAATVDQQAQAEQAVMQEADQAVTQQVHQVALVAVLTAVLQEQQPITRQQKKIQNKPTLFSFFQKLDVDLPSRDIYYRTSTGNYTIEQVLVFLLIDT